MNTTTRTLLLFTAICFVGACAAPAPTVRPAPTVVEAAPQTGDDYLRAASQSRGIAADALRLRAAEAFFAEGEPGRSDRLLQALAASDASARFNLADQRRLAELHVLLALASDDLERAELWMGQTNFEAAQGAEVRTKLCELAQAYTCAAEEAMRAATWHNDPTAANDRVWRYLVQAHTAGEGASVISSETSRGWWSLLELVTSPDSIGAQRDHYETWRRQFPAHPASQNPPNALTYLVEPWQPPAKIGVLLPLSGNLKHVGRAVRDGVMAAYLADSATVKPELEFFDTAGTPVQQLYEHALNRGAEVIIGPLLRPNASALAATATDVPIIALNRTPLPPLSDQFYQLAVAIEDEAATVSARLAADERRRVLAIFSSEAQWAERAYASISTHPFELMQTARVSDATQMTEAIGQAMLVNASQARHARMEQILGEPLEFSPRGRKDLDAVVAFVDGVQARALAPALRYHFANRLPVYVGSQALRGNPNIRALNGFHVTDMPLLIEPSAAGRAMVQAFNLDAQGQSSLYALGADAYAVADRHKIMAGAGTPVAGHTGTLRLDAQNLVVRAQAWGLVQSDQLRASNVADQQP